MYSEACTRSEQHSNRMKKILTLIVLALSLAIPAAISAQSPDTESCYIYSYLHFAGKGYKAYGGKILSINSTEEQPILSADNTEIKFATWTAAMSYLTTLGWEFVCIDEHNPDAINAKDRYILIRKPATKDHTVTISLPKNDGK